MRLRGPSGTPAPLGLNARLPELCVCLGGSTLLETPSFREDLF